jgi:hypothetical protein
MDWAQNLGSTGAMAAALGLGLLLGMVILDVGMVVSLLRPGDERRQLVVWKASAATLLGAVGLMFVDLAKWVAQMDVYNPFVRLGAVAIVYFVCLLYYRKKYGG